MNENENTMTLWDTLKSDLKEKLIASQAYRKKQ